MSSVTDVVTGIRIRLAYEVGAFLFSNHKMTDLRSVYVLRQLRTCPLIFIFRYFTLPALFQNLMLPKADFTCSKASKLMKIGTLIRRRDGRAKNCTFMFHSYSVL